MIKPISFALLFFLAMGCEKDTGRQVDETPIKKEIDRVLGIARVEPEEGIVGLTATGAGNVIKVLVGENEQVEKGQVLIVLNSKNESLQLKQAQSKLETQRANIKVSKLDEKVKKAEFLSAKNTYDRNVELFAIKGATKMTLDDSRADMEKREIEYMKAKESVLVAQEKLNELNADVDFYKYKVEEMKVLAPYSGRVLSLDVYVGDNVSVGKQIGELAPSGGLVAVTEVDELFSDKLEIGQKAEITSQSTGKLLGRGEVYFLADFLKKQSLFEDENNVEDRRVRTVKVRLDSTSNPLINSRVDCLIRLK